jgi:hypothetical protein
MKALIHGTRICEVKDKEFPVAPPLVWVVVPDGTTAADTYVNGKVIKYVPEAEEQPKTPPSVSGKDFAVLTQDDKDKLLKKLLVKAGMMDEIGKVK